jgi:hypothetical protein
VIVYDLVCSLEHKFEGWFPASGEFDAQRKRGLLECPVCGDRQIERVPSAIRINREVGDAGGPVTPAPLSPAEKAQRYLQWVHRNFEDVGTRFPEEARRIHHGETPQRRIRGQASRQEVESLVDEGVPVLPVPVLPGSDLN